MTDFVQLDINGHYSYADYLTWKFEQAVELIKGKIFPMSGPSRTHQKVSWNLTLAFGTYLKGKACEAYAAPFDVRLYDKTTASDKDIFTVVQPDLCVICDIQKLDERGCLGAPDLVLEILSPGNSNREMKIKKELYAQAGVREYWVIDTTHETVSRYDQVSQNSYGRPMIFVGEDTVQSEIFPELGIPLASVFER